MATTVADKMDEQSIKKPPVHSTAHSTAKLLGTAFGIFACYFYFGVFQEKITSTTHGPDKERFTFIQALVFVQCIANALLAYSAVKLMKVGEDRTPQPYYAACSFSYLAAMMSSNLALRYVPYPTQVLGKSCKPIPVMVLGVLFAHKRYPFVKYMFVLMIVLGVSLFLYKDKKSTTSSSPFQFGFGEALLLTSLTFDGITGAIQDRLRANHVIKSQHIMLSMNLWSLLYSLLGLLATGELTLFADFMYRYPTLLFDLTSFSLASALGQYFIFTMVADFGPLPCSIVTTTRKFFTILFSVLFFGHPMFARQWLGCILVFAGLIMDVVFGKSKKV